MLKVLPFALMLVVSVFCLPTSTPPTHATVTSTTDAGVVTTPTVRAIKIGAFNIQSFGKTKYSKLDIRDYLIQIVSQYDVILIQEIKDKSQKMIKNFLADCQLHRNFSMALSDRLGRSRYREQYAVFYDQSLVSVDKHTVYHDPNDVFHREPMIAQLTETIGGHSLTLMGVHTDPDDVPEELGEMENAYNWAISQGYPTDGLMMGDFNADCNYFKTSDYPAVTLHSNTKFTWMIDSTADTTVSDNTDCAYDRFVSVGSAHFTNTTIDRFDVTFNLTVKEAKKISDHYPIQTLWMV